MSPAFAGCDDENGIFPTSWEQSFEFEARRVTGDLALWTVKRKPNNRRAVVAAQSDLDSLQYT